MGAFLEKLLKRFELGIVISLMILLAVMVAVGTFSLIELLVINTPRRMGEVTDVVALQQTMQRGFGGVLVVLLGLELIETLLLYRSEHHVRVEIVFLVGLIAVGRHVIQIDYAHASMGELFGMAAVILSLALGYFLMKRSNIERGPGRGSGGR